MKATPLPRRGFTLLELLVSLSVVAILIALAIPVIAASRNSAWDAVSMSNLRSHAQASSQYASDHADYYMYFMKPEFSSTLLVEEIDLQYGPALFFWNYTLWHLKLASPYYGYSYDHDIFHDPSQNFERRPWYPFSTSYSFPCAFLGRPEFWDLKTRLEGPSQLTGTRTAEVRFPSNKSLFVKTWPYEVTAASETLGEHARLTAAFADGSSSHAPLQDRIKGVRMGEGVTHVPEGSYHHDDWPPLLHTTDGVHGRDRR